MRTLLKYKEYLVLVLLVFWAYWSLSNTFFQQDEWQSLAGSVYFASKGLAGVLLSFIPVDPIAHFTPLARAYSWITYALFNTRFVPYAWVAIAFHCLNTLLLYYFLLTVFKKKFIAFLASVFFALNSIGSQAVTWVISTHGYEVPTTLILLSLIFFYAFLFQKKYSWKYLVYSLLSIFISLLFHENSIFLFPLYFILLLLYKHENKERINKFLIGVVIFGVAFLAMRVPFFFIRTHTLPAVTDISHPSPAVYPYRLISITLKSFATSFIPERGVIRLSDIWLNTSYPQLLSSDKSINPFIAESAGFDLISYLFSFIFIISVYIWTKMQRHFFEMEHLSEPLLFGLLFVPLSLLPYAFVLGGAGFASILEPRFFYITSIGSGVLFSVISYSLLQKFIKIKYGIYMLIFLFLLYHGLSLKSQIQNLVQISYYRKQFLTSIYHAYPTLGKNIVFFTQSDSSYYGMSEEEKMLPVQIGFGKMLMIWYQDSEKFPGCLYEDQFLIRLLEQGYKSCEGRGFGYYRSYDALYKSIKEKRLSSSIIIAYSWDSKRKKFTDITQVVKKKIDTALIH